MKSRSFLPLVVRMTTSREDDVILSAAKDLLFPDGYDQTLASREENGF